MHGTAEASPVTNPNSQAAALLRKLARRDVGVTRGRIPAMGIAGEGTMLLRFAGWCRWVRFGARDVASGLDGDVIMSIVQFVTRVVMFESKCS